MAGSNGFNLAFYEADSGDIHVGRLTDKTLELNIGGTAQPQPSGPATSPFWFEVNRGATEYGLRPRKINICFETTAPADLEVGSTYSVVVLTTAAFNSATIGSSVTYQGETATVLGKTPENIYPGI